jgi:excisionase family DNA binding protein
MNPPLIEGPLPESTHAPKTLNLHELLTVDDVAGLLRVSKSWVYEHTRSRAVPAAERLPHIRIGKYLRFESRAVSAFLARKSQAR